MDDMLNVNAQGGMTASGSIAQKLLACGMKVDGLRTNTVLRKDEWIQFDTALVGVARARLVAVGDLMARGLTMPLANALGTTVLQWEQVNEMSDAEVDMSGLTEAENDRVAFTLKSLPIPIIHKDFKISVRALEASRRLGETLDMTQIEQATRRVAEMTEKMLFDGNTLKHGGGLIYGYKNHPNRNTGSLNNWADTTNTTGEEIVGDVMEMIGALVNDNQYGPYVMYVPLDYYVRLSDDYKAASDRTIMERLLAIPGLEAIRPSANLPGGASGQVVLVQMTKDTVDIVEGMQPTMVEWDTHAGMMANFKVMSIMVPRVKADVSGQSGIAHWSV